jgi:hypothetical protein
LLRTLLIGVGAIAAFGTVCVVVIVLATGERDATRSRPATEPHRAQPDLSAYAAALPPEPPLATMPVDPPPLPRVLQERVVVTQTGQVAAPMPGEAAPEQRVESVNWRDRRKKKARSAEDLDE